MRSLRSASGTVDHAVGGDHAREEELRDRLDDAAAGDPGDRGRVEARLVAPPIVADHPEPRLQRLAIDADALDRPGAARCPQEICAPSNAGPVGLDAASSRSRSPSTISAFVPTSTMRFTTAWSWGASLRITPGGVGAHVSRDARQHVHARSGVRRREVELASPTMHGLVGREGERRTPQLGRIESQEQVVHDRVADHRELEHVARVRAGLPAQVGGQPSTHRRIAAVSSTSDPGCIIT